MANENTESLAAEFERLYTRADELADNAGNNQPGEFERALHELDYFTRANRARIARALRRDEALEALPRTREYDMESELVGRLAGEAEVFEEEAFAVLAALREAVK